MEISATPPVSPIQPNAMASPASAAPSASKSEFANVLGDLIRDVNQELLQADQAVEDFESGKTQDLNSVVMASVKADLSFRFLIEMRNRLTETYQELSRMQF